MLKFLLFLTVLSLVNCVTYFIEEVYTVASCSGSPAVYEYFQSGECLSEDGASLMYSCSGSTATLAVYTNGACTGTPIENSTATISCLSAGSFSTQTVCGSLPSGTYVTGAIYSGTGCTGTSYAGVGVIAGNCVSYGEAGSALYTCTSGAVTEKTCLDTSCSKNCTSVTYQSGCNAYATGSIKFACGSASTSSQSTSSTTPTTTSSSATIFSTNSSQLAILLSILLGIALY